MLREFDRERGLAFRTAPGTAESPLIFLDSYITKPVCSVFMAMETTMQVIAEPRRQAILDLLREEELPVGELVRRLGMSQPLMSKHLRVLKDAGLVEVRADAQRRLYRIRPEPLAEIDHWLAPYRELWSASLDRLERHLDTRRNP
jgi:DNA-binding transcriptional ArsR family regulator